MWQVMHNSVGLCWCRARIGDPCLVHATDRSTETLPSLRHISYPVPQSSVTAEGTTFISAMMDSHTTRSVAPSVSWHTDAHKYDRGNMDARQGYPQALLRKQSYVINGCKGSLLAGFDDVLELIVKCCV